MATPIDRTDAKRIIESHQSLLRELAVASHAAKNMRDAIKEASDALVNQELFQVLKEIPVEEINREKRGFRIKALHDFGYHTIADVSAVSAYTIASIHGISDDSAYAIKGSLPARSG